MFNFFLIASGIFANAYVTLLFEKGGPPKPLSCVLPWWTGTPGVLLSVLFVAMDFRNKHLVEMGEAVLRKLERDKLFTNKFTEKGIQLGFLRREEWEDEKSGRWRRFWHRPKRHAFLIPLIELMVAFGFGIIPVVWNILIPL